MGPHRALYEAIRDRLLTEVSWIKWTDLQKGQFKQIKENYPLPLPCVLVEIQPTKWEALQSNRQNGPTTVSLYLHLDHSADSLSGTEAEDESIELLDHMDEIFQKLTGISSNYFQRLTRIEDRIVGYGDRMVIYRIDFQTMLYDHIEEKTIKLPPSKINSIIL
jgi:hypothetical protein